MEMDVETMWKTGKESYHQACEKVIPSKRKKVKAWISAETWDLRNERRILKERKGNTKSGRLLQKYTPKYSEVHKAVKRSLRKDKRSHYDWHLATEAEIEEAASKGEQGEL